MAGRMEVCVALLSALMAAVLITSTEAGCWERQLCCPGKNVTCKGSGPRLNDVKTGKRSRVCFCDEYCLNLRDCCHDYHDTCKPVDCVLGGWESWGACSVQCGYGQKSRNRTVLVKPRNGGKDCGIFQEMKYCHGTNCKRPRHVTSGHQHRGYDYVQRRKARSRQTNVIETAKVIPAMYGSWRKSKLYDPFNDIRKNLFNHYSANSVIKRPAYCAHFEITHTKGSCNMRNHYQGWTQMFQKGQTVCVECQPLAMKRKLGVRCSGDGIYLKETRWNAITMPGCHGKWMLKSEHRDCTCDPNSEMSFILL